MKYQKLLEEECRSIVDSVLTEMSTTRTLVKQLKSEKVPKEPILYRWWFPEDAEVVKLILKRGTKDAALAKFIEQIHTCTINGKLYYAIYFGKSNKGYRRYIQHAKGNAHVSTIRHTLYGLCIGNKYDKAKEQLIDEILEKCYFEWISFKDEEYLIECIEVICIALGSYPLNIDGNPSISEKWREHILESRKLKNY